jgi:predicted DNA-binding transcriptional regulator YafY
MRDRQRLRSSALRTQHSALFSGEAVSFSLMARLDGEGNKVHEFHYVPLHDELHIVKVRISSGWARWVGEKIWHESQKITKLPDGGLDITFRVAGLDEIKRWVLSLGPEAVVLEPEKLKEMVRKDLSRNLAQYSKSHVSIDLMKGMRAV